MGITSQNPKRRWNSGHGYEKTPRFYSAIKHYGWDGFEHIILSEGLEKEEAERAEAETIAQFNATDAKCGYNIENGGVIHKLSPEQVQHLREVNTGKIHTEETKRKMSEAHRGLSVKWLTGSKQSEATRMKRGRSLRGKNNGKARSVFQYELDGTLLGKFDCMEDAKKELGLKSTAHISQCCRGERGKAHGFMWSYEYEQKKPYKRLWKGGIIHG